MILLETMLGRIVTGVEVDDEETALAPDEQKPVVRVYVDARYLGRYVLAAGQHAEQLLRDWAGAPRHLFLRVPQTAPVYLDSSQQLEPEGHRCPDPRAGTLKLDERGRCFWCAEQIATP